MKLIKGFFMWFWGLCLTFYYRKLGKILYTFLISICLLGFSFFISWCFITFYASETQIASIKKYVKQQYYPDLATVVYDDQENKVMEFAKKRRYYAKFSEIPKILSDATVAAEDKNFWDHNGVDAKAILRALGADISSMSLKQGGSTLTQQMVRNVHNFPKEKTIQRKVREGVVAVISDQEISKEEILERYFTDSYYGRGAYGVTAAADVYFNKELSELSLAEAAFIAGLTRAPSIYSNNSESAKKRQIYVLGQMFKSKKITQKEFVEAKAEKLVFAKHEPWRFTHYLSYVRQLLIEKYGKEKLYTAGYKIYLSLNQEMQVKARETIEKGLFELDRRQGFRGAIGFVKNKEEFDDFVHNSQVEAKIRPLATGEVYEAIVAHVNEKSAEVVVLINDIATGILEKDDVAWAFDGAKLHLQEKVLVRLKEKIPESKVWYVNLFQESLPEAAFVCMDVKTNQVKAMIGGRSFEKDQFNIATQGIRQSGSAFKPIVYAAAFEKGYHLGSKFLDAPIKDGWPQNYGGKYSNKEINLLTALALSKNTVAARLFNTIGTKYGINFARKIGIKAKLKRNDLSLALGSQGIPLLQLVGAYNVFASEGLYHEPVFIVKVLDRYDRVIEDNSQIQKQKVMKAKNARKVLQAERAVVEWGTAKSIDFQDKYAIGKTGTTDNCFDALFIGSNCNPSWRKLQKSKTEVYGEDYDAWLPEPEPVLVVKKYNPEYTFGVWVGFKDEVKSLGKKETGSRAAGPIWNYFLQNL